MLRFALAATLIASPALAASADLDSLDRLAEAFAGAPIGEDGGPASGIDRRLRLAACKADPEIDWHGDRRDALLIRCPDPRGWRLFVPIKGAAAVARGVAAPAKAEPVIRRGDPVTIAAGSAGFSVTQDGIAMSDARPGARIAIKVDGSKSPVQAIAVEAGRATLPGW